MRFDAGVCSWASLGYPAKKDEFQRWWPSKWITEAHDQTRGWFYSQLVTGVAAFGKSPYESVLLHGWALTPTGEAMSKSEGTAIDPVQVVNSLGADSLRLYLLKANAPWEDVAFQQEGVKAANRTLNILWNGYKFASLYMSIDHFDPLATHMDSIAEHLRPEDKWMLSRIESLKKETTDAMEVYELHRASRAIEDFIVTDLSRWYGLRDGAQFSTQTTLAGEGSAVLTGSDDYFQEGIWGVVAFGNSFHWVGAAPVQGYGYFDRMALWDRALSGEEGFDLFNNGLGWSPG